MDLDNSRMIPVSEPEQIRGLPNMLRSEMASWWTTKKWIMYALVWSFIVNMMVFLLFTIDTPGVAGDDKVRQGMTFYAIFGFISSSIGIVIAMQDSIIGEKQTGTAAWVLSKPISRGSFVAAKLVSNVVGTMATMVLAPGLVVYLQVGLVHGTWLPFGGMLAGMALLMASGLLFLTLCLFLGTMFDARAPLLGIALGFLFGMQYITSIDRALMEYIPYPIGNPVVEDPMVVQAIYGEPLWSVMPVVVCLVASLIFSVAAVIRFDREEF